MLEASSHGLSQGRVNGLDFKAGIFTNLTQDHLDYHKSMKNYFQAKLILFKKILKKNSYLILDKTIPQKKILEEISRTRRLKKIYINSLLKKYDLSDFKLIGNFQLKNLLMAIKSL